MVYGSKAVGEPPLMLAFSVREALRQACAAFGPEGLSVELASPATPEAVLLGARPRPPGRAPTGSEATRMTTWCAGGGVAARVPGGRRAGDGDRRPRARAARRRRQDGRQRRRGPGRRSAAATSRRRPYAARATCWRPGPTAPETFVAQLSDKAPFQHGVQCCGGEVSVLLEPLRRRTVRRDLRRRPRRPRAGPDPGPPRPRPAPRRLAARRTCPRRCWRRSPTRWRRCTRTPYRCCPSWCSPSCRAGPGCW